MDMGQENDTNTKLFVKSIDSGDEEEQSEFSKFTQHFKDATFGVLFLLNKDVSVSPWFAVVCMVVDFVQLLAFNFYSLSVWIVCSSPNLERTIYRAVIVVSDSPLGTQDDGVASVPRECVSHL